MKIEFTIKEIDIAWDAKELKVTMEGEAGWINQIRDAISKIHLAEHWTVK